VPANTVAEPVKVGAWKVWPPKVAVPPNRVALPVLPGMIRTLPAPGSMKALA
jgi:hypothetical protein